MASQDNKDNKDIKSVSPEEKKVEYDLFSVFTNLVNNNRNDIKEKALVVLHASSLVDVFMSHLPGVTRQLINGCRHCNHYSKSFNVVFMLKDGSFTSYFDVDLPANVKAVYGGAVDAVRQEISRRFKRETINFEDVELFTQRTWSDVVVGETFSHLAIVCPYEVRGHNNNIQEKMDIVEKTRTDKKWMMVFQQTANMVKDGLVKTTPDQQGAFKVMDSLLCCVNNPNQLFHALVSVNTNVVRMFRPAGSLYKIVEMAANLDGELTISRIQGIFDKINAPESKVQTAEISENAWEQAVTFLNSHGYDVNDLKHKVVPCSLECIVESKELTKVRCAFGVESKIVDIGNDHKIGTFPVSNLGALVGKQVYVVVTHQKPHMVSFTTLNSSIGKIFRKKISWWCYLETKPIDAYELKMNMHVPVELIVNLDHSNTIEKSRRLAFVGKNIQHYATPTGFYGDMLMDEFRKCVRVVQDFAQKGTHQSYKATCAFDVFSRDGKDLAQELILCVDGVYYRLVL
jgi:hypothetical protein